MLHPASVLLVGLVALCGITAYADTHWVNLAGSNVPPYTSYGSGAHDIQTAIDEALKGDTVRAATGVYDIAVTIALKDSVTLVGAGMDSSVLSLVGPVGSLVRDIVHCYGFNTLSDFELTGNGLQLSAGVYAGSLSGPVEIVRCRFGQFDYDCAYFGWGEVEMHDCEIRILWAAQGVRLDPYLLKSIHHNVFSGSGHYFLRSWSESEIFDNVFIKDDLAGWAPYAVIIEAAMGAFSVHNNLFLGDLQAAIFSDTRIAHFHNNTILVSGSTREPLWVFFDYDGGEACVLNNIFQGYRTPVIVLGPLEGLATLHFQYNIMWPRPDTVFRIDGPLILDTIGVQFVDPMLSSDSNFYLQAGSPAIDTGDPTILDIDGSRSDIGMHGGPGGTSYAYPQESPRRPDTLLGSSSDNVATLTWRQNTEADLAGYRLYRDVSSGFLPNSENLRAELVKGDTCLVDTIESPGNGVYYQLTAQDTAGLESSPSNEVALFATGILDNDEPSVALPNTPFIVGNYPNPFNASTTIEYVIPDIGARPTMVQVNIYDALGRKIATLVNEKQYPGKHYAAWDGCDNRGISVASGVYFARLIVWGYEFAHSTKLVLEK